MSLRAKRSNPMGLLQPFGLRNDGGETMSQEKCCCGHCAFLWLSGFFAMPAVMHLVRVIAGWPLTLAEHSVTTKESIIVIVVTGIFSAVLGIIGCVISHGKEGGTCA